ncbi:hypothetical protein PQ469_14330 [Mucilaginibacter sp. KACC 22773]|uniref:hypothetical protein n=1 Tax=Mucilaginibacter sp. KACC 22773 TaxID=3025671 RepID=UPI002365F18B|nr:hypothetical protein [Mucilaginibacter sp. KACC 22773]WDF81185.1 hypothetical protein PQ469_14330 [Mucilaginibacter sp. KACC 22773]
MKKYILIIVILIVISNLPLFSFFLQESYTYSNEDNTFTYSEEPGKGNSFWGCQRQFGRFLCQHPEKEQGSNLIYRTFTIKPWRFWEWREMIFHSERFGLPYKSPDKIKPD